ncbi:MAG: terpene cyclase/mutase family protein [Planctomycetota bacterium]|nr:terpene cyclase/mutase family protein [Planctomycetota bacterium]
MQRSFALCLFLAISFAVQAEEDPPRPLRPMKELTLEERRRIAQRLTRPLINRSTRYTVRRGLKWLARKQQRRGFWLGKKHGYRVGISALAGMAFLSAGNTGKRGEYSAVVERTARYLVANQRKDPELIAGLYYDKQVSIANTRPLHGHGLALLFLAQSYGELQNPYLRSQARQSMIKAIALTENCQTDRGGWNYMPGDTKDEGSVTVTQIQALRAARNCGFVINTTVINNAVQYIVKSQDRRGGIHYRMGSGKMTAGLTAAGITVLNSAGFYHKEEIIKARQFLNHFLTIKQTLKDDYYYYKQFYAGQAYFQEGPRSFRKYYEQIREELIQQQKGDGSWENAILGDEYATAMALLILQIPHSYLPIYQR